MKMAEVNSTSDVRIRRKNISDNLIFEVDLDDCSPEYPKHENDEGCIQKSFEFSSQDSGVFSQEIKVCSKEIEFNGPEILKEDNGGNGFSIAASDSKNTCNEKTLNLTTMQPDDNSRIINDYEAVKHSSLQTPVQPDNNKMIIETTTAATERISVTEKIQEPNEEIDMYSSKIEEAKKVTDNNELEAKLFLKNNLKECETVDGMIFKNTPEEGELLEECSVTHDSSIISINFKDATIAKEYKSQFIKFLRNHLELRVETEENDNGLTLYVSRDSNIVSTDEWIVMDETFGELTTRQRSRKRKRSERKKEKDLFVLDTSPSISTKENVCTKYLSKFCVSEIDEDKTSGKDVVLAKSVGATCFNCDGNHSLKDCTEPKNYTKINTARNNFKGTQTKSARYHLEEDQIYSHFIPGKITENLRKALGLRKNELPPYIYRMRLLGYPPGWIKEAEEEQLASNLYMFDIDGKTVDYQKKKKCFINAEKVIDYPGFNAPMFEGAKDDYRYYGVPPFSTGHDKQVMIDFINKIAESQEDNLQVCGMELEKSLSEEVPATEISDNDISQESQDHEIQEISQTSPSLIDLETQKQQLLAELDTNTSDNATKSPNTDERELKNIVKTSRFGTPILKTASPYSKLPKPDNFSQNISDVINFENLPNSTGKYEQMTGVLQKVRVALKSLQGERKT